MHPRNRHQDRYDLMTLLEGTPELRPFIIKNPRHEDTIDFSNPQAVKLLNKALLKAFYDVGFWNIPDNFLCPPVPGRADYIHYLADLMDGKKDCIGLDIGTGANCIYPLIGHAAYNWKFICSEINEEAVHSARNIIDQNKLSDVIEVRHQSEPSFIFKNIIRPSEQFDFTMCNPPFHASAEEARSGSERKWRNLGKSKRGLNFGGQSQELWCEGGEKAFISRMIKESFHFKDNCRWFTSLVSKAENLSGFKSLLKKNGAVEVKVIEMKQGQKTSRFIAWKFL